MKKIFKALICLVVLGLSSLSIQAQNYELEPDGTFLYDIKDGQELFMDVYYPRKGSETTIDGKEKPTVLFIFGGGFKQGTRDNKNYKPWFNELVADGFKVVSIDYRLGLKGVDKMGLGEVDLLKKAVDMGVQDLYSATAFIVDNYEELGIDPDNIVISGSSAGAIISLQAEYYLSNEHSYTENLPKGFNYAGVMAYAGAIYSDTGKPEYGREPAPTIFFHGTDDKMVPYGQIWFFKQRFAGADVLSSIFEDNGYNYNIYRFDDMGHEISGAMYENHYAALNFIYDNVMNKERRIIDATVKDPSIHSSPEWKKSFKSLY